MAMSPLALQAKRTIEAAWLHGAPYDLASQAAFALESVCMLQSPETAAEGELSAHAVQLAEDSVAELRREHEENARLRARVAELEAERHTTNEALDDAARALREQRDRIADLERPATERHRSEVRESYQQLAAQARQDGDYEGEAVVLQQLAERESVWAREDELAHEFAVDPLAMKPYVPGPSVAKSADKLTRMLAPTQVLREVPDGEHAASVRHTYRVGRDLPPLDGAQC